MARNRCQLECELADEDYCYVTTVGRVSGNPHTVEIWFGASGDTIYVLAGSGHDADFVKNAKKHPAVAVRIASTKFDGHGAHRPRRHEDTLARKLLLQKYAPRAMTGDLDEWGRDALPVAFDLAPRQESFTKPRRSRQYSGRRPARRRHGFAGFVASSRFMCGGVCVRARPCCCDDQRAGALPEPQRRLFGRGGAGRAAITID